MTIQALRRVKEVAANNPLTIIEKIVKDLGIKTKLIGKPRTFVTDPGKVTLAVFYAKEGQHAAVGTAFKTKGFKVYTNVLKEEGCTLIEAHREVLSKAASTHAQAFYHDDSGVLSIRVTEIAPQLWGAGE